jgi:hypothetical protein
MKTLILKEIDCQPIDDPLDDIFLHGQYFKIEPHSSGWMTVTMLPICNCDYRRTMLIPRMGKERLDKRLRKIFGARVQRCLHECLENFHPDWVCEKPCGFREIFADEWLAAQKELAREGAEIGKNGRCLTK